jgi:hypothetical protein
MSAAAESFDVFVELDAPTVAAAGSIRPARTARAEDSTT